MSSDSFEVELDVVRVEDFFKSNPYNLLEEPPETIEDGYSKFISSVFNSSTQLLCVVNKFTGTMLHGYKELSKFWWWINDKLAIDKQSGIGQMCNGWFLDLPSNIIQNIKNRCVYVFFVGNDYTEEDLKDLKDIAYNKELEYFNKHI